MTNIEVNIHGIINRSSGFVDNEFLKLNGTAHKAFIH